MYPHVFAKKPSKKDFLDKKNPFINSFKFKEEISAGISSFDVFRYLLLFFVVDMTIFAIFIFLYNFVKIHC